MRKPRLTEVMRKTARESVCVCPQLFPFAVSLRCSWVPLAASLCGNHEKAGLLTWKTHPGLGKGCGFFSHKMMPLGQGEVGRVSISIYPGRGSPGFSSCHCVCRRRSPAPAATSVLLSPRRKVTCYTVPWIFNDLNLKSSFRRWAKY